MGLWRKLVFFVGNLHLPNKRGKISNEELKTVPPLQPGDIGLHRDAWYLSNLFIPGFMKHAWIHVEPTEIIEAISEGVVRRHYLHPLRSHYSMILRPKAGNKLLASEKAKGLEGCLYDDEFLFDIEEELKHFEFYIAKGNSKDQDKEVLRDAAYKLKYKFSCTEVVAYAYWHARRRLRLYREKFLGKKIIKADQFINKNFEIIWASESCQEAEKLGLHEEGLELLDEYFEKS